MTKTEYDNKVNNATKDTVLSKDEALEALEQFILIEGNKIIIDGGVATPLTISARCAVVALKMAKDALENAAPVKHGHWIDTNSRLSPEITYNRRGHYYICSVCGRIINVDVGAGKTLKDFPYCHCGAMMDEKSEAE